MSPVIGAVDQAAFGELEILAVLPVENGVATGLSMQLTGCVSFWPKAPVHTRRNLLKVLKFQRSAMGSFTAGGIWQGGVHNLLRCTESNRSMSGNSLLVRIVISSTLIVKDDQR